MPRKQTSTKDQPATAELAVERELPPVVASPADSTAVLEPPPSEKAEKPAYAADPDPKISVSLSDVKGGPEMHLLRSHKFKQMQVRFDGEQPGEEYRKMLTDAGWKDRSQEEGVYTKQIDRDAKWQSVAKMEEEFKAVANAIRKDRGLGPVLQGLAA